MRTFTVQWQAEWSSRKIPMMRMDVSDFIRQQGGKHVEFNVKGEEPPKPKPLKDFACSACEAEGNGKPTGYWAAQFFVPCPTCGRRETVRKMTPDEVAVMEAAKAAMEEAEAEAAEEAAAQAKAESEKPVPVRTKARPGRKHKKHNYNKEGRCRVCKRKKPGRRASAEASG